MAADRSDTRGWFRLARLGKRLGAPCHAALLSAISSRSVQGSSGLANGSSALDWDLLRHDAGILAQWLRDTRWMHLCERGSRHSPLGIHSIRARGFSGIPVLRHSVHIFLRVALWGTLGVGLSACAQLQHGLEAAAGQKPASARTVAVPVNIQYRPQPRLSNSWQGSVGKRGLTRVIVQKNPAIVVSPAPQLLWLQAYPHGYPETPHKYKTNTSGFVPANHPNAIEPHPFQIPQAWFADGEKRQVLAKTLPENPWQCQPTKLPCGKKGTDYWACHRHDSRKPPKNNRGAH